MTINGKKQKGLLDTLIALTLLYGIYSHTPVGALAETGYRILAGQKYRPSLFATFKGRETEVTIDSSIVAERLRGISINPSITRAAKKYKIDPFLLYSLVRTDGRCNGSDCTLTSPPYISDFINSHGDSEIKVSQAADAIYRAQNSRGFNPEQGVEALYCGIESVRRAVRKAEISQLKNYREAAVHAAMFPPGIRRGDLQKALAVLATYRVSTLQWPMEPGRKITSPFGMRKHPFKSTRVMHTGVDISAPVNTPVTSVQRGRVHLVSRDSVSGIWLRIDHGFGIFSTYCHLNSIPVRETEWVKKRQVVAKSGNTGLSTGPHLHYSLRINREPVDPVKYGFTPGNLTGKTTK